MQRANREIVVWKLEMAVCLCVCVHVCMSLSEYVCVSGSETDGYKGWHVIFFGLIKFTCDYATITTGQRISNPVVILYLLLTFYIKITLY